MRNTKLCVGAIGSEVTRLHALLKDRGFKVTENEVKQGFFGPETRQVVIQFQKKSGLQVSGVVDATTAAALSKPITHGPAEPDSSSAGKPITAAKFGVG